MAGTQDGDGPGMMVALASTLVHRAYLQESGSLEPQDDGIYPLQNAEPGSLESAPTCGPGAQPQLPREAQVWKTLQPFWGPTLLFLKHLLGGRN